MKIAAAAHGELPGQQVKQGRSQAIQVAARIGLRGILGLLGSHEVRRTETGTLERQVGLFFLPKDPGEPKVEQLDDAVLGQEEIRRLEIAMNDAAAVGIC